VRPAPVAPGNGAGQRRLACKRSGEAIDTITVARTSFASMRTTAPADGDYTLVEHFDGGRNFGDEDGTWERTFS
jgi:hypothetical protein